MQRKNKDLLDKMAKDASDRDGLYVQDLSAAEAQ
jgi:hypothetical protein